MSKNVYIIAGPNGVGKTTFAREFLPRYADCRNFINADLIAQGISPLSPDAASLRAGRLMIEEINRLAKKGSDFGFETTLAGKTNLALIRRLKSQGYNVVLFFLWVSEVELLLGRVRSRVIQGGHNVPGNIIRRRFPRSIAHFFDHYRGLADLWLLFDTSGPIPDLVARGRGETLRILRKERYSMWLAAWGG
jgi:predicted ABC-type ATPase